jgi:hypothetical protein
MIVIRCHNESSMLGVIASLDPFQDDWMRWWRL